MTVGVDFDGPIHAYSKGWHDGTVYDVPTDGAFDALRELMRSEAVFVLTSRVDLSAVAKWISLLSNIPTTVDTGRDRFWNDRTRLLVTNRKLPAKAYIDDRGIRWYNWNTFWSFQAVLMR
jgi:hypothetical protein